MSFAALPAPPYYIVSFSSLRTDGDNGYGAMADTMAALAAQQPGYLGVESARDAAGLASPILFGWTKTVSGTGNGLLTTSPHRLKVENAGMSIMKYVSEK